MIKSPYCQELYCRGVIFNKIIVNAVKTLPKEGNSCVFQNYRTGNLMSHPSKVMLRVMFNEIECNSEKLVSEEQTGFNGNEGTLNTFSGYISS